ncbi:MAG: polyamine aminopropyltransferase [Bacilli bacterium]|nr:polyamine aminopropyltransferase [Bacilli bacterium]
MEKNNLFTEKWTKDCLFSIEYTKHLHHEVSDFQVIDYYDSITFGKFFTLDGILMITEKDEFAYHDMIAHVPMAVNPQIEKVLIIGGGDGGSAREISRYSSIKQIDMVEIDERVVRLTEKYIPQTASTLSSDQRINLFFEDGLAFVNNTPEGTYDLILVDSTDPVGPGEGLFTLDFYRSCYKALKMDGILINQHESPYFERERREMKRSHHKIDTIFPIAEVYQFFQPTYPSGYWLFGFASKTYHPIADHKPHIWEKFNLKTKYYNSDLHKASFMLPTYVKEELSKNE